MKFLFFLASSIALASADPRGVRGTFVAQNNDPVVDASASVVVVPETDTSTDPLFVPPALDSSSDPTLNVDDRDLTHRHRHYYHYYTTHPATATRYYYPVHTHRHGHHKRIEYYDAPFYYRY